MYIRELLKRHVHIKEINVILVVLLLRYIRDRVIWVFRVDRQFHEVDVRERSPAFSADN